MKRLYQFYLNYIDVNEMDGYPGTLTKWKDGTMGGKIGASKMIYSLQVYGCPGTQFWLNNGLIPIELGPSGYYALELGDLAGIYKLEFDEENLRALYNSDSITNFNFIPLIIDAKIKDITTDNLGKMGGNT